MATQSPAFFAENANTAADRKIRAGFETLIINCDGRHVGDVKKGAVEYRAQLPRSIDVYDNVCVRFKEPGELISYKLRNYGVTLVEYAQKDLTGPEYTMPKWGIYKLPALHIPMLIYLCGGLEIVLVATAPPIVYVGAGVININNHQERIKLPGILKAATPESPELKQWPVTDGYIHT